ncbi:MAG: endonuclease/exonuclease/phosphatase family protein [Planctomycetota bacterium]
MTDLRTKIFSALVIACVAVWFMFSVACCVQLDTWQWGMIFTYPPRLVLIAIAIPLAIVGFIRHRMITSAFLAASICFFLVDLGIYADQWNPEAPPVATTTPAPSNNHSIRTISPQLDRNIPDLRVLSFNIHNQLDGLDRLNDYCEQHQISILCFQEVEPEEWSSLESYFPSFTFFRPDTSAELTYDKLGAFTNLIGIRNTRLAAFDATTETGITEYRTYAVQAQMLDIGPLWIVDVHTAKAFSTKAGLVEAWNNATQKSQRHRDEANALSAWLQKHQETPILAAGDFNAPLHSHNLRLPQLTNAQVCTSLQSHLSFPRSFPVWGIDHVLSSKSLQPIDYELIDMGYSDHLAQLATLRYVGN